MEIGAAGERFLVHDTLRARQLDLAGTAGGAGYWTAGTFEGRIILEQGAWRFQTARSSSVWSAPYPGGWARIP